MISMKMRLSQTPLRCNRLYSRLVFQRGRDKTCDVTKHLVTAHVACEADQILRRPEHGRAPEDSNVFSNK